MASDVMAVRLHLRQIRVLEVPEDALDVLRVSVESTFRRLRCAQCGFKCHRVHDRRDKKIRDPRLAPHRQALQISTNNLLQVLRRSAHRLRRCR